MRQFNNLSIKSRLSIAFCTMSVMIIATGLLGLLLNNGIAKTIILISVLAASVILSTLLTTIISVSIYKPLQILTDGAKKLAAGDTKADIPISTNDEIGKLAFAYRTVIASVGLMTSDAANLAQSAMAGDLSARADDTKYSGDYQKIISGFNSALDAIVTPINEAISVLGRVNVNDLTEKIEGCYNGDMKILTDAINETIDRTISTQEVFVNLSKGDMSQLAEFEAIGRRSNNDLMIPAVIKTMSTLNQLIGEAKELSSEAASGNLDVRGDASAYEGLYGQLIDGVNNIIDAMAGPISETVGVLDTMAGNDFTALMSNEYKGAFAGLSQSINSMLDTLNQTLGNINDASEQVASGTNQVAAGSQALSQGATEQASAIEQLTASLTEIAAQTRQNALNATQASQLAISARDEAEDGNARMKELQQAMAGINDASQNISKIIKVIDDIAFQTNLLALNAAVEAARAGQHGKGFAVVAEEVRNLAQRSAGAAKETTAMIEESINKVKSGTKIANNTAESLGRIMGSVEKATQLVGGIAEASNEQATAVAQVNKGIEQVSQVTQTNSATAEESAAASQELSNQVLMLKDMVGKFSLRGQSVAGRQKSTFKPKQAAKALPEGKLSAGKPKISLTDK